MSRTPASRPAKGWSIARSWAVAPSTGADDAAYIVRLADEDGSIHDLTVEFGAPSSLASVGYAEEIARRFLRGELPRHVVVDVGREVQILDETLGG